MQVGPGFFSSFKDGGVKMNLLAVTGICLNVVIMLAIYFIQGGASGDTSISQLVGIMSGAVTNTPGLGAAQQTYLQVNAEGYDVSQQMSMGYAAAYPLGVVGIILTMILIRKFFKTSRFILTPPSLNEEKKPGPTCIPIEKINNINPNSRRKCNTLLSA